MKKSVSFVLLVAILLQSCATYQKKAVSINQASEKGKVKVVTNNGKRVIFNNIINEGGNYYGIYNYNRIPIDTIRTTSFYLRTPSYHYDKYYRIWLYLKDGNNSNHTKGYLYEVKDSSLRVSLSNPRRKKSDNEDHIFEFQVHNINEIKLRRIGNVARGALVGFAIGSIPIILKEEDYDYGLIIAIPAAVIGGLLGTSKESINIDGSIEQFSIYRHNLRDQAFVKQEEY